jgi:hypothetical protein
MRTLLVAALYFLIPVVTSETAAKKTVVEAVKTVARHLGNRPATCRKYYIHPAVVDSYMVGSLHELMGARGGAAHRLLGPWSSSRGVPLHRHHSGSQIGKSGLSIKLSRLRDKTGIGDRAARSSGTLKDVAT